MERKSTGVFLDVQLIVMIQALREATGMSQAVLHEEALKKKYPKQYKIILNNWQELTKKKGFEIPLNTIDPEGMDRIRELAELLK